MLEFFKKNHLFNSLLLLPYAVFVRTVALFFVPARIEGESFGAWGADLIQVTQTWGGGQYILSSFLVFIQAVMINRLFIKQSMLGEINLFPGVCYILLSALHPSFLGMSSVLLANTTLLLALGYLFDVLKKERQEATRFLAGWWLAISGLLFTPYLVLLFFGLLAMSMLKTLKLKEIFQYLTGFISPFVIGWMVGIIRTSDINPGYDRMFADFGVPSLAWIDTTADFIVIAMFALLLLISILSYGQMIGRKNIHAQKKIDILYALVFFSLPMTLFPLVLSVQFLLVLLIPFSLFLAILLRTGRQKALAESVHFILWVTALSLQVLFIV